MKEDNVPMIEVNFRILKFIQKKYGLGNFYSVSVTSSDIRLQGKFHPKLVKLMKKLNIKIGTCNVNGYVEGCYKNRVYITLTE